MTVLELVELKKKIEEEWGITAAAPVAVAAPGAAPAAAAARRPRSRRRSTSCSPAPATEDPGDQGRPRDHRASASRRPRTSSTARRTPVKEGVAQEEADSIKAPARGGRRRASRSSSRAGRFARARSAGPRHAGRLRPRVRRSTRDRRSSVAGRCWYSPCLGGGPLAGACRLRAAGRRLSATFTRFAPIRTPLASPLLSAFFAVARPTSPKGGCIYLTTKVTAPRARKSFSRLKHVLDLPNLIDIQKASLRLVPGGGSPRDDRRHLADRGLHRHARRRVRRVPFGEPPVSITGVPREGPDVPGSALDDGPLRQQGDGRDPRADGLHGRLPDDDRVGHVHHQRHRARDRHAARPQPGRLPDGAEGPDQAGLHREPHAVAAARGSSSRSTRRAIVYARIDRKRKLPITTLLRALPAEDPTTGFALDTSARTRRSSSCSTTRSSSSNTLEKDPATSEEEALIEVFKKQRPGEPPTLDNARNLLRALFFDPKRYDLTKVGRYKLNQRLDVDVPDDTRVLTTQDIVALVRKLVELPKLLGVAGGVEGLRGRRDRASARRRSASELDEYEHFGNRRLRTVGELIQEAFRVGLYRMERVVRERMTTEDVDTITPQTIINIRPVVAALKEFFGSSQLSQFMDQTNSLAGPHAPPPALGARRRRADARARADRGARRPPDALRAHVPDRDAGRPEHRPDRLARVDGDRVRVRLHPDAVPRGHERQGDGRDRLPRRGRGGAVHDRAGLRAGRRARRASSSTTQVLCRSARGRGRDRGRRRTSTTWTSRRRRSSRSRRR